MAASQVLVARILSLPEQSLSVADETPTRRLRWGNDLMATINGTAGDDTLNGTSGDDTIDWSGWE